jgi:hypothetical protein
VRLLLKGNYSSCGLIQARMRPEKVDSLADDVKPLVLELLRQNSAGE